MSGTRHWEQDKEATVYVGNLDERVTDALVWELMLQAGRIVNVHLPKDRVTQSHQGYGFVEFKSEEEAEYAARIMNQVRLYAKPIRVNKASADKQKTLEIGAELFIGNLDPMVTEQTLYETFSRFGNLLSNPKIARDDSNLSKGYGFISFTTFEASDEAIANLNAQYLMNKEISVQYAKKKDGKQGLHGDQAERMLAAEAKKHMVQPMGQPMPASIFLGGTSGLSPALNDTDGVRMGNLSVPAPGTTVNNRAGAPGVGFPAIVTQPNPRPAPQSQPLPAPPSGLPARPPPSQAGYGGPHGFLPHGFNNQQSPSGFGLANMPGPLPPGFQTASNSSRPR